MKPVHNTLIRCYDCNEMVKEILPHKRVCPKRAGVASSLVTTSLPVVGAVVFDPSGITHIDGSSAATTTTTTTTTTVTVVDKQHEEQQYQDVYYLIDVSSSMSGPRLRQAKEAASDLISHMNPKDRMAIITFDESAYFKLKPRPVEEIQRNGELPGILDRIFAKGSTAIWDSICLAVSQVRDKSKRTQIIVLTDGEDNASKYTHKNCLDMLENFPAISLNILHINGKSNPQYQEICDKFKGVYKIISEMEIVKEIQIIYKIQYFK
ncbi:hypothetical protein DLAC_08801 [Tieghemostelium lacteum]|uniref:VWFA domain-containing protein n=1 Tax=Tieghemostelium lacteum TaxID=361077 RepID=A0A151Z8C5_TIELA|nr:hypothetical protein DLAC_08801 [Tieghemostelium lacteum]|eukprot:KYQ90202.1 hypothetical protein DLAC_08801 [Tieghemostelium lacteum]